MSKSTVKAVLFDLDDTLYDHLYSARQGLRGLARRYPCMQTVTLDVLEQRYSEILESTHVRLLHGELSTEQARCIRFQHLFGSFGVSISEQQALDNYARFRQDYDVSCRVVSGSHELLRVLRQMDLPLAIVTNNMVTEQQKKLQKLKLTEYFDVVSISEEVGAVKPDPQIFLKTLDRLNLSANDVVMVGDSLTTDIAGATALNIRSVWLNRQAENEIKAPGCVATIENDFNDLNHSIRTILASSH